MCYSLKILFNHTAVQPSGEEVASKILQGNQIFSGQWPMFNCILILA